MRLGERIQPEKAGLGEVGWAGKGEACHQMAKLAILLAGLLPTAECKPCINQWSLPGRGAAGADLRSTPPKSKQQNSNGTVNQIQNIPVPRQELLGHQGKGHRRKLPYIPPQAVCREASLYAHPTNALVATDAADCGDAARKIADA